MQKRLFILMMLVVGMLVLSCDKGEAPDPSDQKSIEAQAVEKLTDGSQITWIVANGGSVSKDGQSVTADYMNFELRLISTGTSRNYSTTANPIFDQSGTWSFLAGNYDKIQLSGQQPAAGKEISFSRNGNKLMLVFNIPLPNARVTALAGSYVFELVKK